MNPHVALLDFFMHGKVHANVNQFVHSSNRGEAATRLSGLLKFVQQQGLATNGASLLTASAGELMNNSFDHNLGYWQDVPGCCTSWTKEDETLILGVADRGRGIVGSLRTMFSPSVPNEQVLKLAFEQIISGRSPEKRGNGLKFVRNAIQTSPNNALKCFSNDCVYQIGNPTSAIPHSLAQTHYLGTLIFLQWSLR